MKKNVITLLLLFVTICTTAQIPGSLDSTFGIGGIVVTPINVSVSKIQALAIQTDGKILAAGWSGSGSLNNKFAVVRYNTNGTVDSAFGNNGIVLTQIGNGNAYGLAIALQTDGKIIVAGQALGAIHINFALARYYPNGALDSTFGTNGTIITSIGNGDDVANAILIQPNGKIIAAGMAEGSFGLARYNINGTLDGTFGIGGTILTNFGSAGCEAKAVALQTNGNIVVAGQSWNSSSSVYKFKIMQLDSNGALNPVFGIGGAVETVVGNLNDDRANAMAIQNDGRIVAAGWTYAATGYDFALVRYNTNGTLDNTFGTAGIVATSITNVYDEAYAVTLQSDGKIVAVGYTGNLSDGNFALLRYNTDGTLDNNFGFGGIVTTPIDTIASGAYAVALQPDGKIIAAGFSYSDSTINFALARYYGGNGTGIKEIQQKKSIMVYPNPASFNLTIVTPETSVIEISNIEGQIVKILKIKDCKIDIDISDLSSGVYIIKAMTDKEITTKKFIKN